MKHVAVSPWQNDTSHKLHYELLGLCHFWKQPVLRTCRFFPRCDASICFGRSKWTRQNLGLDGRIVELSKQNGASEVKMSCSLNRKALWCQFELRVVFHVGIPFIFSECHAALLCGIILCPEFISSRNRIPVLLRSCSHGTNSTIFNRWSI